MITEVVIAGAAGRRGWGRVWSVDGGPGAFDVPGFAFKSPLTGAWLVAAHGVSTRVRTLKGARAFVIPGNGRQHGRHSSIDRVATIA